MSVNAIEAGRRSRTRDAIGGIRHVFLDVDRDGAGVLRVVASRDDLPAPSYVLHSSEDRVHIFWRVDGFDATGVERLQKRLATELFAGSAATPVTQTTRIPGFDYLKSPVATTRDKTLISPGVSYTAVTNSRARETKQGWRDVLVLFSRQFVLRVRRSTKRGVQRGGGDALPDVARAMRIMASVL